MLQITLLQNSECVTLVYTNIEGHLSQNGIGRLPDLCTWARSWCGYKTIDNTGFYLGFFVWGRRSELKLMVGGGSVGSKTDIENIRSLDSILAVM